MTTQQNIYKPKASGLIWFGSIGIGAIILALELYGAWRGFPADTAAVLSTAAIIVALWGIFLTKFHDEPGEKFTTVSAVCKIALLLMTGAAGIILFNVAREISVASDVTTARSEIDKQKRESLLKVSEGAGKQGKFQAAKGLAAMDTAYIEKPMEIFKTNESKANIALTLNILAFALTFIAMFLAFIFLKTAKQTAAECGYNPDLVINQQEQHRLSQIKFRDPSKQPTLKPEIEGDMPDGKHWKEIEKELNTRHPNTQKGARTEIDGTLYESNGRTWEAQGVYGGPPTPSDANIRGASDKGHFIIKPASSSGFDDSVSRHSRDSVATGNVKSRHSRDTDPGGTGSGIEKIREALRTGYASAGNFFFKAEDKTGSRRNPGVLIRQMAYKKNGQEYEIANYLFDVELMAYAENNSVQDIGEYIEKDMFDRFDLEFESKPISH